MPKPLMKVDYAVTAPTSGVDVFLRAAQQRQEQERAMAQMLLRQREFEENKRAQQVAENQSRQYLDIAKGNVERQKIADERDEKIRQQGVYEKAKKLNMSGDYEGARQLLESEGYSVQTPGVYRTSEITIGKQPAAGPEMEAIAREPINQDAFRVALAAPAGSGSAVEAGGGTIIPRVAQRFNEGGSAPLTVTRTGDAEPTGRMTFTKDGRTFTLDREAMTSRQQAEYDKQIGMALERFDAQAESLGTLKGFGEYLPMARAQVAQGVPADKALDDAKEMWKTQTTNDARLAAAKKRGKGLKIDINTAVFDPSTGKLVGHATDATAARATGGLLQSYDGAMSVAQKLKESYEQGLFDQGFSTDMFSRAWGRKIDRDQLSSQLGLMAKEIEKLGVLTGPDMGILNEIKGGAFENWTGIGGAQKMARLMELMQMRRQMLINAVGAGESGTSTLKRAGKKRDADNAEGAQRMQNGGKTWNQSAESVLGDDY